MSDVMSSMLFVFLDFVEADGETQTAFFTAVDTVDTRREHATARYNAVLPSQDARIVRSVTKLLILLSATHIVGARHP